MEKSVSNRHPDNSHITSQPNSRLRTLESQSARTLKMRAAGAADHTTRLDEVH
jgi:hypothetical protein